MQPFTDKEWDTLPHVHWTSPKDWDPSALDVTISDSPDWYQGIGTNDEAFNSNFDAVG